MTEKEILLRTHEQTFILELESFLDRIHESVIKTRNQANDTLESIQRLKSWITKQEIKKSELRGA